MIAHLRRVFGLIFVIGVLYGMQRTQPLYSEITSPILSSGRINERVEAHDFTIRIDKVRAARRLTVEIFGKAEPLSTSGVWIVAEGEAEARSETLALTAAEWLSASGLRYMLSDRLPATIGMINVNPHQPGLPDRILMVFEVPEGEVAGGQVAIARNKLLPLSDEVQIAADVSGRNFEQDLSLVRNEDGAWSVLPQE